METLTILWLDDQRNPNSYFTKKDKNGEGTLHDNLLYYQNLRQEYNLNFIWVKNYKEFVNFIESNGVPQMISFDHDLTKASSPTDPKGLDCARWLVQYCKKRGVKLPKTYVHSANPKWRGVIRNVLNVLEEQKMSFSQNDILEMVQKTIYQLQEAIFMDKNKINNKQKKVGLTYNRQKKIVII